MPRKTVHRRSTLKAGSRANSGANQEGNGCQGSIRETEKAPKIISDSIFGLKLLAKPGIEVIEKMGTRKHRSYHDATDDYYQMYHDLLECFQNAMKLKGQPTAFDPLANGLEIGPSIHYVLSGFRENVLPDGFELNIERNDDGYYFVVFTELGFPSHWHPFSIKKVVTRLYSGNKKLHDLFLILMASLMRKTGLLNWWNGGMGYADYAFQERISNWDDEYGYADTEEEIEEAFTKLNDAEMTLDSYQHGSAKHYQNLLIAAKVRTPASILRSLSRFNQRNSVVKWMTEACLFMMQPGQLNDFIYYERQDEEEVGVSFDQQSVVCWDDTDMFSETEMEALDAEAQGIGIEWPILNKGIVRFSKSLDFDELEKMKKWPGLLHELWVKYDSLYAKQ